MIDRDGLTDIRLSFPELAGGETGVPLEEADQMTLVREATLRGDHVERTGGAEHQFARPLQSLLHHVLVWGKARGVPEQHQEAGRAVSGDRGKFLKADG